MTIRKSLAALALCAPLLAGCGTLSTLFQATTGSVSDVAPDAMKVAKKGLAAAHATHEAAALGLIVAAKTGYLHGADALKAKDILDRSEALLIAGDNLVIFGDAQGIEAKISAANALSAQVQGMLGRQ